FAAVKASHRCRYFESLALSRLLQHVTETVDALSSVRTYGVVDRFARHFYRLTDAVMRGYICFGATYGFVRTVTSAAGFVVVVCTLLTTVVFAGPGGPDPASLGPRTQCSVLDSSVIDVPDVTLVVKPMEKVGVVGRTGAGKSSLVLALLRMLRSITVIPQDPSLVRGTLRRNLDPTNSHSDEDIWQALERSHLSKVVSSDAKGLLLETTDGGTNLSVGQRQLVCLARALLRQSKILLLDEATSQMDGDTDRLIQATLRDAFANCTLFTIAHRIHTVMDYDRILVLEQGRVREFDSVSKLLSDTSSAFYNMAVEAGIRSPTRQTDLISVDL
ncbi:hypothetical protein MTO96_037852, partial [Rhipicephalus appendiculatus]